MREGNIEDRLLQAQTSLLVRHRFLGFLMMKLRFVIDTACPTMCTDGREIRVNPKFIEGLTDRQLLGGVTHEVGHCAIGSMWRRGGRDPLLWNVAEDFAINATIKRLEGMELPPGGLYEKKWDGLSGEEIYAKLPVNFVPPIGWDIGGTKEVGQEEASKQQLEWSIAVRQAATVARAAGDVPSRLEQWIGELLRPRVDWKAVLWRFMQAHSQGDYSYRKPSRRGMVVEAYLPSLYSETMGEIAEVFDTSGSTADYLTQFASEEAAVVRTVRPKKVWRIYCDARVHKVEELVEGEEQPIKSFPGGGGTDFRPVFKEVEKRGIEPVCMVFLTDLEGPFPKEPPPYPVLWVTPTKAEAPWGETVRMENE